MPEETSFDEAVRLAVGGLSRESSRGALSVDFAGEVTPEDLAWLEGQTLGSAAAPLKRLRDSHHQLARVLAAGAKPEEASRVTGFSLSRISILQADASFQTLLEFYRGEVREEFKDLIGRMATLSMDVVEELRARLEEAPEKFTVAALTDLLKTTADRTGAGPSTKNLHLHGTLPPEVLNHARQQINRAVRDKGGAPIKEIQGEVTESHPGLGVGRVHDVHEVQREAETPARRESEGAGVREEGEDVARLPARTGRGGA